MFSRTAQQVVRRTVARGSSTEASATPTAVKLNFALPHETIYNGASVYQVIIPGVEGEYGVTANHVPYVAQLKPGVLQILHEEIGGGEPEKYFVAGGYALTHDNSTTVRSLVMEYENDLLEYRNCQMCVCYRLQEMEPSRLPCMYCYEFFYFRMLSAQKL